MGTKKISARRCMKMLLVIVGITAWNTTPAQAEWTTYQGNAAHNGYVASTVAAANISRLWTNTISTYALGDLAVGGNGVYVNTNSGYSIIGVNEQTGVTLWSNQFRFGDVWTISSPAYANGMVYYQTENEGDVSLFRGVKAATGAQVFATPYNTQWTTYLNPTPFAGTVYAGGGQYGGIYSYNGTSGAQNWFGDGEQYDGWTPAVDGNYAYSFTGSDIFKYGQFRMMNLATGATKYMVKDNGYDWGGYTMNSAVVLGTHDDAFTTNGWAGGLVAFSTRSDIQNTPHVAWELLDHYKGQPTLANGVLYVNDNGSLVALDELTGHTLWKWSPPSGSLTGNMIATDNVLFATTAKTTYALDLNTHVTDWSYDVSGNLALSDNTLFVAGSNGNLYAFSVPEPSSMVLLAIGGLFALAINERKIGSSLGANKQRL